MRRDLPMKLYDGEPGKQVVGRTPAPQLEAVSWLDKSVVGSNKE